MPVEISRNVLFDEVLARSILTEKYAYKDGNLGNWDLIDFSWRWVWTVWLWWYGPRRPTSKHKTVSFFRQPNVFMKNIYLFVLILCKNQIMSHPDYYYFSEKNTPIPPEVQDGCITDGRAGFKTLLHCQFIVLNQGSGHGWAPCIMLT